MDSIKKVALVTGAAMGVGKVIAMRLAKDGYNIALNDINEAALAEAEKEIRLVGVDCIALKADVSDAEQVKEIVGNVIEKFGRIDVLINNAGVAPVSDILELTPEAFSRAMRINCDSMYTCAYYVIPHMIKQGGGKILNAGSTGSFSQTPVQTAYCTSKWAVRGLTRTLACALAKYKINVNAYCPGAMYTPMQENICQDASNALGIPIEDYIKQKVSKIPIGRWIKEEEIADFIAYLASPGGDCITGQCMLVDGGTVMN